MGVLRMHGVEDTAQVKAAYLEATGEISVIKREEKDDANDSRKRTPGATSGLHKQGLRHRGRKIRRGVANGLRCLLGWSARLRVAHRRSLALRAARRRLAWHGALVLLNVQRRKRLLIQGT